MKEFSMKQKICQLIISRLEGDNLTDASYQEEIYRQVDLGIGGFILFGGDKNVVREFIQKIQLSAAPPLFIASDIERGVGQQIHGATQFPSQMAIAASISKTDIRDLETLRNFLINLAAEAIDYGINMPFIPVLDVNSQADNPIICTRAFSDDPDTVGWLGQEYIRILEGKGLISCAKHFPGHGDTLTDSHISLPRIVKSRQELFETDIPPFKRAIEMNVSSIMIGHLSIPAFDKKPAPMSYEIITKLLRKELVFDGLIVTDALNMHSLDNFTNVPERCMNAGVDILLHPSDVDSIIHSLIRAVESGELNENTIDRAVERILRQKAKMHDHKGLYSDYLRGAELSERLYDRSITLVKGTPEIIPVTDTKDIELVIFDDGSEYDISVLREFIPAIKNCDSKDLGESGKTIVIALFTSIAAWKGSSGIVDSTIETIRRIIQRARNSTVISFGSPYVLRHFTDADLLIAAFDPSLQAQRSVIKCLKGEISFRGRLPIKINFKDI